MKKTTCPKYPTLKAYREGLGLSQDEAASKFHVTQAAWSKWERGKQRPARRHLKRLVRDTGVPLASIMGLAS